MKRLTFLSVVLASLVIGGLSAHAEGPYTISYKCSSGCPLNTGIFIGGTLQKTTYLPGETIYMHSTANSDDNPQPVDYSCGQQACVSPIAYGTVSGQTQSVDLFPAKYSQQSMRNGIDSGWVAIGTAPNAAGTYTVSTYYSAGGYTYATGSLSFTVNPFCTAMYQTSPDTITWDLMWDQTLSPGQSSSPPTVQDSKHRLSCTSSGTTCTITGTSGSANYVANCGASAPPPTNGAACSSLSAPTTLQAGQSFSASVTMNNTGNTTWTSANNYKLGSQSPQDNTTWGVSRVSLPSSTSPGSSATFSGTLTAPATAGTYTFAWQMLQEYVAWFGGTCSQSIQVCNADAPYTETNATNIANYCSGRGVTCPAGQQYVSSISCHTGGAGTWQAYGPSCTGPNCTGCGCIASSYILTVNSSGATGVAITSSTGHGGTTNYTKTIAAGTSISLTAPSTAGGNNFSSWSGCTSVSGTTCTGTMPTSNTTVTVNYVAPSLPDLTAAGMDQSTATAGSATTLSASISNIGAASTGSSFPNFIQVATAAGGGGTVTGLTSATMSALAAGGFNSTSQSYTFPSAGTYSARACANTTNNSTFSVTESNYGNNCGAWTTITVSAAATAPSVTTSAVSGITQTSASSGGTITSNGGSTVTVSGIVWSTSANPTTASNIGKTTDGWATGGPWPSAMSGLTAATTYHVRAYATNSVGTSYGGDVSFTTTSPSGCGATTVNNCVLPSTVSGGTAGSCASGYSGSCNYTCTNGTWGAPSSNSCVVSATAPTVTTSAVSSITQTSASSGGTINSNGGSAISVSGIVWSTSSNPTTASNLGKTTDGWASGGPWPDTMSPLTAGTTYHVRAYATNAVGTSYGSDVQFTTTAPTGASVSVSPTSCTITTAGANSCTTSVTWNLGSSGTAMKRSYDNAVMANTGNPTGSNVAVQAFYPSMYFYITDSGGTTLAQSQTVTVSCGAGLSWNGSACVAGATAPTVTTDAVTSITQTSATGSGTTVSDGGSAISLAGLVWSTSSNPTTASNQGITYTGWASGGPWLSAISGLTAGTTYHVRAYATNAVGTSYGSDVQFTTTAASGTADLTAAGMNQSTATAGQSTTLSATISNIGTAGTGTSFPNFIQVATAAGGAGSITDLTSTSMAALAASGNNTTSQSYTFPSAGTYSARACANKSNSSTFGSVSESNYNNNCGAWTTITVASGAGPYISASSPTCTIPSGNNACPSGAVTLAWDLGANGSAIREREQVGISYVISTQHTATNFAVAPKYPSSDFWLLDSNGFTLDSVSVTASCQAGTSWTGTPSDYNSGTCQAPVTPTASLTATPSAINKGQSSTLSWSSTNATSCTAAGGFSTGNATSGSVSVSPSTTSTYSVTCTGTGGTSSPANATVTVATPNLSISAAPPRVQSGNQTTITWSASSVKSCSITKNGAAWKSGNANGSNVYANLASDTITAQSTYVLSCTDVMGAPWPTTVSVIVNTIAGYQEF